MTVIASPPATPDALVADVESAFERGRRVGVRFPATSYVYTYRAPARAHVGSLVLVPPSWYRRFPRCARVVTLSPRPFPGRVRRVLAVLS